MRVRPVGRLRRATPPTSAGRWRPGTSVGWTSSAWASRSCWGSTPCIGCRSWACAPTRSPLWPRSSRCRPSRPSPWGRQAQAAFGAPPRAAWHRIGAPGDPGPRAAGRRARRTRAAGRYHGPRREQRPPGRRPRRPLRVDGSPSASTTRCSARRRRRSSPSSRCARPDSGLAARIRAARDAALLAAHEVLRLVLRGPDGAPARLLVRGDLADDLTDRGATVAVPLDPVPGLERLLRHPGPVPVGRGRTRSRRSPLATGGGCGDLGPQDSAQAVQKI